jgi:phospholipid/cholesterol/gamma-HCH transport system permease protein
MAVFVDILAGYTGRWWLSKINLVIDQLAFFWVCLKSMGRYRTTGRRLMKRIIVQQIYFTGVQSVELIVLLALLIGGLVVVQGITQLVRVGQSDELSTIMILILVRELGPMLTAIVIILRSGSAITMEIGYMKVLGEIEGLEMQGIHPLHYLAVPRLIGVTLAVFCLMIIFNLVAIAGGFIAVWALEGLAIWKLLYDMAGNMNPSTFFLVAIKGISFGLIIPTVCLFKGFQAEGAITSVPPRVSQALVNCLIYCVLVSILISIAFPF